VITKIFNIVKVITKLYLHERILYLLFYLIPLSYWSVLLG